jgi:hypothetical protein
MPDTIAGQQVINIGLPNESTGSDSLYTAFSKTKTNFSTLFSCVSPYTTFANGVGIGVNANSTTGTVTITNTGVTNIIPGTGIIIDQANGNVVISSTGGGGNGGGTVTSIAVTPVSSSRITVTGSPIVSNGTITLDLATTGVSGGTYTYPTVTVDNYGRITSISNAASVGTVYSVSVSPGDGIQVTGSPITTTGNITVTNTGVTRLNAGAGILLSGSNGNVSVSASLTGGTVTSVGVQSSTLSVTGSPITTAGIINVNLPNTITLTGNIVGGNLISNGIAILNGSEDLAPSSAANLAITATYFTTVGAETATLAAGTNGQIKTFMMSGDGGDMVITVTNAGWKSSGTGTMTFNDIGDGCTLQYVNSKWYCIGNNGVVFA